METGPEGQRGGPAPPPPLVPPGPDRFRRPYWHIRAAGAPARGPALAAGGGGARTHARMRRRGRRIGPVRGKAGAPAAAPEEEGCLGLGCRLLSSPLLPRQAPIGSARPYWPHPEQQEPQPRGPRCGGRRRERTHARMRRRGRRIGPVRGKAGRSCSGSRGGRRSGDWAAACCRLRCCRRAEKDTETVE
nr:serine/threonine-protein phosphatase 1 regulatory subunit 10-like [Camelus dromedarius]